MEDQIKIIQEIAGKSPEEITKMLEELNIKGKIDPSSCCPLAKYFRRKNLLLCEVTLSGIDWADGSSLGAYYPTTSGMKSFIKNFDCKKYPNLIEEEK